MALTESLRDRWPDFPALKATVKLTVPEIAPGSIGRGQIHLENVGSEMIDICTGGPFVATVLDPSTMQVVAGSLGRMHLGTGIRIRFNAAEQRSVPFVFGTTSSKDHVPTSLSPGEYLVKADLPIFERRPDGNGSERSYLTMPLTHIQLVDLKP